MKDLIKLKDVWKVYHIGNVKVEALKGVNFSIKQGDFISIMGPSGSGKSTMLHLCGLLDTPTKGELYVGEINASKLPPDKLAELRNKKIGFIFQKFNLMPHLTALENVALPHLFSDENNENETKERAKLLLDEVGLKHRMNNKPNEMSGGEQQRVAIARALINDPEIIFADEPTGNLDSKTGKQIMDILTDLHKNHHKTLAIVTHDPEITSYSKRFINIRDGQIIHDHQTWKSYLWRFNRRKK